MKKLLLLILLLVLCSSPFVLADGWFFSGGGGGAACTEVYSLGESGTDLTNVGSTGREYYAFQFTAGDWSTISKMQVYIDENGDVDGYTWTLQLYTDSGNDPSTKVTNGSCTFSGALVGSGGSPTYVGCTLSTPVQLTNTTSYHMGLNRAGSSNAANYVRWYHYNTGGNGYDENSSPDESSWTATDFDADGRFKLFTGGCSGN